ncbi:immunity 49 family protein [Streptomyces nojiriensis]
MDRVPGEFSTDDRRAVEFRPPERGCAFGRGRGWGGHRHLGSGGRAHHSSLCNVPPAKLRESGSVYDAYDYAWIETLQAFWLGRPDFADKLMEAARGTDPDLPSIANHDHVSQLSWPPMDLLRWRATGSHEEFNRSLEEALRAHEAYWTSDQGRADSPYGWVALAPLAMACLAQDADFPIEVESEYLPEHLLKGTWAGEFPT